MFSERNSASLLKRGNSNGKSRLEIQESLEEMLKVDQNYVKIDLQEVPSDVRRETVLWMMQVACNNIRLPRSSFYKAVHRYDSMCAEVTSDDLEWHKLLCLAALRIEDTIHAGFETLSQRQWLEEYCPLALSEAVEEEFAEMEESLLRMQVEKEQEEVTLGKGADYYLDKLVFLIGDSSESNEEYKTVLKMKAVLDVCIVKKQYRMYSPLALTAGVYFWYARGAQAPWLHFLSSMCPDMSKAVEWVAPIVKFVNELSE